MTEELHYSLIHPLTAGATLWNTLNHLRSTPSYGNIHLVWDQESPNTSYISVNVASSLRLLFSGSSQRLFLVEVLPPAIPSVLWKGQPLIPSTTANDGWHDDLEAVINPQRMLNSRLGPTYPPTAHPSHEDECILAYPGVVFGFPATGTGAVAKTTSLSAGATTTRTNSDDTSILTRVIVSTHDPNMSHAPPFPDVSKLQVLPSSLPAMRGDIEEVQIQLGRSKDASTSLLRIKVYGATGGTLATQDINLGETTSEDLLCDLGPPLRTFFKEDDRLSIHAGLGVGQGAASSTQPTSPPYFFNYFDAGIDFLLHPETNRVMKAVLHSNTPGEALFGKYGRCRWKLQRDGSSESVTCDDTLDNIKGFLSSSSQGSSLDSAKDDTQTAQSGTCQERAMLLDRLADSADGVKLERPTELLAYPGCILEVTQNKVVETLWLV